ncbi:MAG: metal ABC transporter permease [Candidatus Aminicenantes bacterium]|nr:metal ABC transporter permease [Candidatus Aminicenantes bacterium]
MIEMLQLPFMQRALLTGLLLGLLLAALGIFVSLKRMSFYSDGMAHAALAGAAIGLLTRSDPLLAALVFGALLAVLIFFLERKSNLPIDSIIGIMFTSGMALGIVLISFRQGYQPELLSFLFGNILAIRGRDLALIAVVALPLLGFIYLQRRKLTLLALDREMAHMAGFNPDAYQLLLYVFLALALVLGLRVLGVVLVSAVLIIPVSTARLLCRSFKALARWTFLLSEVTVIGGLLLAYRFDLPASGVIVLLGTALFALAFAWNALRRRRQRSPAFPDEPKG